MVKSVLPVRGVTIGAGGSGGVCGGGACQEINVESSQTRRNTHTRCSTHTRSALRGRMTRSGAAHNVGLMRHSRTATLAVFHTPADAHACGNLSRGSVSFLTTSSSYFFFFLLQFA